MTPNNKLKQIFGIDFPQDFFAFREFLEELKGHRLNLGNYPLSIRLAGTFNVFDIEDNINSSTEEVNFRFYNDPPEFITLLWGEPDGLHWGYWFDDPSTGKAVVASYYHSDAFNISQQGYDLFTALENYLDEVKETMEEYLREDRKNAREYQKAIAQINEIGMISRKYSRTEAWDRRIAAPTRDGMGIVVAPEQYQPLLDTDRFLQWDYSPTIAEVEAMYRAVSALATNYPGTELKLGKDLWIYPEFHETSYQLLEHAYKLLDRPILVDWLAQAKAFRLKTDTAS
jgi:hypothetical protein